MSADEIEGEEWMAEWEEEEEEEGGAEPVVGESSLRMFDSLFLFLFSHLFDCARKVSFLHADDTRLGMEGTGAELHSATSNGANRPSP